MNRRNDTFKIKDKLSTNAIEMCEHFNEFFINVGPTLSKNIPLQDSGASDFIERLEHTLYLFPTDIQEMETIIKNLNNSSAGWDDISPSVLKYIAPYITKALVNLINLSFQEGLFPDELKIARVIPLYKNDDPMIFSNYRPVSILTAISKIYEKIMYNRLVSFLSKWKLLYQYQFGFRQHHSTYMALTILMDKLISALKEGKFVLGLFLDFSKAFDTINHILFDKLDLLGIRGTTLCLFKSYLTNRYQYVEYNNEKSSKRKIVCGVPQGSILGPLLFLIYINDLPKVSNKVFPLMFADDSNIFIERNNILTMQNELNMEMIKISSWLKANKLSLNINKTHFMLFKGKNKIKDEIIIKIDHTQIKQTQCTKFLDVQIDDKITWKNHIIYI